MADKVKVKITIEKDADELWSMIFGAAGESWEWWLVVTFPEGDWDKAGTVYLEACDPDDPDDPKYHKEGTFTIDDVVRALEQLSDHPTVMECLANEDFDAVYSDVVMQQMLYGEVIFG